MLARGLKRCVALKQSIHRISHMGLSSSSSKTSFSGVPQGGNLVLDVRELRSPIIVIESKWQDHVDIEHRADREICEVYFDEQVETCTLEIIGKKSSARKASESAQEDMYILATVPELINITLIGDNVDLTLKNKIHGDLNIQTLCGNITIDKIRGSNINIETAKGNVTVNKLMEGNVTIESQKLNAKMLNGDIVELKCTESIDIEAMYAKKSILQADHDVTIGLMSGETNVYSKNGDIKIGGIDGTFNIIADEGHINMQINKSIFEANSVAYAKKKSIAVNVDPKIKANLYFEVFSQSRAKVTVVSQGFKPIKNLSNDEKIITGSINECEKAIISTDLRTSGKINTESSEKQSLRTILTSDEGKTMNDMKDYITKENATFAFVAYGNILFESLSWMESIRRRHGFTKYDEGTVSKGVGRTASSKLRAQEIAAQKTIK